MKEFTNDEIQILEKECDKLFDKAYALHDKIKQKKKELVNLDYEGKFIKYNDGWGRIIYMRVDWVTNDSTRFTDKDFSYLFRGLGFDGEFTGYGDATDFSWGYWYEFYIYGNEQDFLKAKKIGERLMACLGIFLSEKNSFFLKNLQKAALKQ